MAKNNSAPKKAGIPLQDFAELKTAFAGQLREQEERRQLAREERALALRAQRERDREARLLDEEFADVVRLPNNDRVVPDKAPVPPLPRQRELDDSAVLQASLSDEIDVAQYLESDETLSYCARGVGPDVVGRLRGGDWAVSAQIDLHGLRRDEAREALVGFLEDCRRTTKRCVRVIHGKGLGSVNREPVLKDKVRRWLVQRADVLAFCQTRPNDGGSGALLVLLAGRRG